MRYFATVSGSASEANIDEKVLASNPIMEVRTVMIPKRQTDTVLSSFRDHEQGQLLYSDSYSLHGMRIIPAEYYCLQRHILFPLFPHCWFPPFNSVSPLSLSSLWFFCVCIAFPPGESERWGGRELSCSHMPLIPSLLRALPSPLRSRGFSPLFTVIPLVTISTSSQSQMSWPREEKASFYCSDVIPAS